MSDAEGNWGGRGGGTRTWPLSVLETSIHLQTWSKSASFTRISYEVTHIHAFLSFTVACGFPTDQCPTYASRWRHLCRAGADRRHGDVRLDGRRLVDVGVGARIEADLSRHPWGGGAEPLGGDDNTPGLLGPPGRRHPRLLLARATSEKQPQLKTGTETRTNIKISKEAFDYRDETGIYLFHQLSVD